MILPEWRTLALIPTTLDEIKRIVTERLEETTRLEFKRNLPESGKGGDLAKDLAAMANAEGGGIIYGIDEDGGRAKNLAPFPVGDTADRVRLIAQTLDEPLNLSHVSTIPDGDKGEGYLVVEVPRSDRAPHFYKGVAWVRVGTVTAPLTRRQAGELFARSHGFAEEFGLIVGRPGRLAVTLLRESHQETDMSGRLRTQTDFALLFENDGEADIFDADWEWVGVSAEDKERLPQTYQELPFPIDVLPAGARMRVGLLMGFGDASNLRIRTSWRDAAGPAQEHFWPVVW